MYEVKTRRGDDRTVLTIRYYLYQTTRCTTMVRCTTATTEGGCTIRIIIIIIISAARDVGRSRLLTTEEVQGRGGGCGGREHVGITRRARRWARTAATNRQPATGCRRLGQSSPSFRSLASATIIKKKKKKQNITIYLIQ